MTLKPDTEPPDHAVMLQPLGAFNDPFTARQVRFEKRIPAIASPLNWASRPNFGDHNICVTGRGENEATGPG